LHLSISIGPPWALRVGGLTSGDAVRGMGLLILVTGIGSEQRADAGRYAARVENKNESFRLPGTVFEILPRFWCK